MFFRRLLTTFTYTGRQARDQFKQIPKNLTQNEEEYLVKYVESLQHEGPELAKVRQSLVNFVYRMRKHQESHDFSIRIHRDGVGTFMNYLELLENNQNVEVKYSVDHLPGMYYARVYGNVGAKNMK